MMDETRKTFVTCHPDSEQWATGYAEGLGAMSDDDHEFIVKTDDRCPPGKVYFTDKPVESFLR